MEQFEAKIETESKGVEKIYTKLKFIKSERNGALISFISQNPKNGVIAGVRQDCPYPKKIVIIDREVANELMVNMLYDCTLIPMTETLNEKTGQMHIPGYIAIEAKPVQFKAKIETQYRKGRKYAVTVKFGNKTIRFDPFNGQKESVKSLNAVRAVLEKRCDVRDLMQVVEDFNIAANSILELMRQDNREANKFRHKYGKAN